MMFTKIPSNNGEFCGDDTLKNVIIFLSFSYNRKSLHKELIKFKANMNFIFYTFFFVNSSMNY